MRLFKFRIRSTDSSTRWRRMGLFRAAVSIVLNAFSTSGVACENNKRSFPASNAWRKVSGVRPMLVIAPMVRSSVMVRPW